MKCYLFRFTDDTEPTGWYGIVFADNDYDLFWRIDIYGNPLSCEISRVMPKDLYKISYCYQTNDDVDDQLETPDMCDLIEKAKFVSTDFNAKEFYC